MTRPTAISGALGSYRRRKEARRVIEIEMDAENRSRLKVPGKKFTATYYERDALDYSGRMIAILEQIRRDIARMGKDVRQPLPGGESYLKQLRDVGAEAYALLPEGVGEHLAAIEADEGERGISLDFSFPAPMALFWELIYGGDPAGPPVPERFWGLRYPIGRTYDNYYMRDRLLMRGGVLASAHHQLDHSTEELEQLRRMLVAIRERLRLGVQFHRLDEVLSCEALNSEALVDLFNAEQFNYGVVHFACHCVNSAPDSIGAGVSRAYLSFTVEQQEVEMTVGEFNKWARSNRGFRRWPLVFLNTCESATPQHLQSLSLPTVLINFGAGGVIATVCTMPDNFASAFATEFYDRLLDKYIAADNQALGQGLDTPSYISEALLETRLHFWEAYRNPLGLAYGLYARSDQRLLLAE